MTHRRMHRHVHAIPNDRGWHERFVRHNPRVTCTITRKRVGGALAFTVSCPPYPRLSRHTATACSLFLSRVCGDGGICLLLTNLVVTFGDECAGRAVATALAPYYAGRAAPNVIAILPVGSLRDNPARPRGGRRRRLSLILVTMLARV